VVQLLTDKGEAPSLREAGAELAVRRREHSAAFIRYKTMDPKRTDGVARAMADQDIDLQGAECDWEIAKRALDVNAQEFELMRLNLLIGEADEARGPDDRRTQPDPRTDEEREDDRGWQKR